jgi:hypothetical protein
VAIRGYFHSVNEIIAGYDEFETAERALARAAELAEAC